MNVRNTIYDLRFAQSRFHYPGAPPSARIHSGFMEMWLDAKESIMAGIATGIRRLKRAAVANTSDSHHIEIIFTGHSLGGAVALLAALDLRRQVLEQGRFPGIDNPFTRVENVVPATEPRSTLEPVHTIYWFGEQRCISFKVFTYGEPRVGNHDFARWVMAMGKRMAIIR